MVFSQAEENFLASYLRREYINKNKHLPPTLVSMLSFLLKHILENGVDTGNGWADEVDHRKPVQLLTEAQNMEAVADRATTLRTTKISLMIQVQMPKKMSPRSCATTTGKKKLRTSRTGSAFRDRDSEQGIQACLKFNRLAEHIPSFNSAVVFPVQWRYKSTYTSINAMIPV
jgi:hypothetical protein